MPKATEVAAELIRLADADEDSLTQMQLHKLLYYVQGLSLGLRRKAAFEDDIQAFEHGPVVKAVRDVCGTGRQFDTNQFVGMMVDNADDRWFIAAVWNRYRDFSASALRKMTHDEQPWKEARQRGEGTPIITKDAMQAFFTMPADMGFDGLSLLQAELDISEGRVVPLAELKRQLQLQ